MIDRHVFEKQYMDLDTDGRNLPLNATREVYNMRSSNTSSNGKGCMEAVKSNVDITTLDLNVGHPGSVPTVTYYNSTQSQTFVRNNCGSGYSGSTVTYTVPYATYSSTISQIAADQMALDDISANGQNNANSTGTCTIIPSGTLSAYFIKGDGAPGGYLKISKNGTLIIDIERYTGSDSFSITDGDAIHIEACSATSSGVGNSISVGIYSSVSGELWSTTLSGYNQVITHDYTYHTADGTISVQCGVPILYS
jgi:hypothetical protein